MLVRILKILAPASTVVLAILIAYGSRQASPKDPRSQTDYGVLKSTLEQMASAPGTSNIHEAKVLAQALQKKPDHVPVLLQLAKVEAESGHPQDASKHLQEALQREPRNLEAKLDLGKLMFETGNIQEAIRQNEEILEVQPDHSDALYNLGAIYGNLGNRERALSFWNRLLKSAPQSESGRRAQKMVVELQGSLQ